MTTTRLTRALELAGITHLYSHEPMPDVDALARSLLIGGLMSSSQLPLSRRRRKRSDTCTLKARTAARLPRPSPPWTKAPRNGRRSQPRQSTRACFPRRSTTRPRRAPTASDASGLELLGSR